MQIVQTYHEDRHLFRRELQHITTNILHNCSESKSFFFLNIKHEHLNPFPLTRLLCLAFDYSEKKIHIYIFSL